MEIGRRMDVGRLGREEEDLVRQDISSFVSSMPSL